jgi:hypothetical protein
MPLSLGFVPAPPTGEAWLHEIKHDGFRVVARKEGESSLYGRPGNDDRFRPLLCHPDNFLSKNRLQQPVYPHRWLGAPRFDFTS